MGVRIRATTKDANTASATVQPNCTKNLPGTPLMQQFDDLGLIRTGPTDQDWSNPSLGNTPAKRIQWHQRLQKKVSDLGYQQVGGADNHFILENMMKNLK